LKETPLLALQRGDESRGPTPAQIDRVTKNVAPGSIPSCGAETGNISWSTALSVSTGVPNLLLAGRTLFGSLVGQGAASFDDHLLRRLPKRVQGVHAWSRARRCTPRHPRQTTHNEWRPGQFSSWLPLLRPANVATDPQQLTIDVAEKYGPARRHALPCCMRSRF